MRAVKSERVCRSSDCIRLAELRLQLGGRAAGTCAGHLERFLELGYQLVAGDAAAA